MKAGRELDILIAENVMKLTRVTETDIFADLNTGPHFPALVLPKYSTDIAAAWEVVEKLQSEKWIFRTESPYCNILPGFWTAIFGFKMIDEDDFIRASNETSCLTAPHAICLAALRAVEYELP